MVKAMNKGGRKRDGEIATFRRTIQGRHRNLGRIQTIVVAPLHAGVFGDMWRGVRLRPQARFLTELAKNHDVSSTIDTT